MAKWVSPLSGLITERTADKDRRQYLYRSDNLTPFWEDNKRARDASRKSDLRKKDLHHVASIPPTIQIRWWQECGHTPGTRGFLEYARRQLNTREYGYLKRMDIVI